ncbi:hypothetical protein BRADI_1g07686v3 [Brachypodium distachyon]|uniref:KIB1-4 beta-propeller domain-containing protein n=1 Tax=Brachypodium distachyon TaxID=15368 RepID=A0A0Q3GPZ8_BRADI|nr:hypothetical protein BRADI_1g07686v3 [Brachypodium distachyon]
MVSALRDHGPPLLPWIVHADGTFVTLPDGGFHRGLTFPDSANFIGASKNWLAFYTDKIDGYKRSYLLYNPFFGTTVPLPELDSVIGQVSNWFEIRKVLMRSAPDDIVAVTTNNWNYPIIVCRPGKPAAWHAQGGDENVYEDEEGQDEEDDDDDLEVLSNADEDDDQEEKHEQGNEDSGDKVLTCDDPLDELQDGDDKVPNGIEYVDDCNEENSDPCEPKDSIRISRYLRQQRHISPYFRAYNVKVEILNVDMEACSWNPVVADDGRCALFVSDRFSESAFVGVKAGKGYTCYFVDDHDVTNRSQSFDKIIGRKSTWFFTYEFVV